MSDNDITYIDVHEGSDDYGSESMNKRVRRFNKDGKKVHGKVIEWRYVKVFTDVDEYQESKIRKEINAEFSEWERSCLQLCV